MASALSQLSYYNKEFVEPILVASGFEFTRLFGEHNLFYLDMDGISTEFYIARKDEIDYVIARGTQEKNDWLTDASAQFTIPEDVLSNTCLNQFLQQNGKQVDNVFMSGFRGFGKNIFNEIEYRETHNSLTNVTPRPVSTTGNFFCWAFSLVARL